MSTFQYSKEILTRYPTTVGGVILAQGITNGPTPERLQAAFYEKQQAVLNLIEQIPLSQFSSIAAWRSVFRSFGIDPTQYRSAAEASLRRLKKKGEIPSINTLVDIGNLVSISNALPVAVFDTQALQGTVTVHFANGTERYTTLGQDEVEHPEVGEVVFSDETGLVIARRWCWRQSEQSAAQASTTNAIITVEAHHENGLNVVPEALNELLELLRKYANGNFTFGILNATHPLISNE